MEQRDQGSEGTEDRVQVINPWLGLRIGAVDYAVYLVENLANSSTGNLCDGCVEWNESRIFINGNLDKQRRRYVLWHEIIHCITDHAGDLDLTTVEDEVAVTILAHGITQVLKDNPFLAEKDL